MKKNIFLAISICTLSILSCKKENNSGNDVPPPPVDAKEQELIKADHIYLDSVDKKVKRELTTIAFDKTQHDFGTIKEGDKVETTFIVKNTGKKDLFITNATGSCGCTVPEVAKEAIKPGGSTPILVKFDSKGKSGMTEKTVTINCNTEQSYETVRIIANILNPEKLTK